MPDAVLFPTADCRPGDGQSYRQQIAGETGRQSATSPSATLQPSVTVTVVISEVGLTLPAAPMTTGVMLSSRPPESTGLRRTKAQQTPSPAGASKQAAASRPAPTLFRLLEY